jgi:UDP-glucose 4-epimerase
MTLPVSKTARNGARRVLVIGGSGFLGRHLIEALLDAGFSVNSLDLIKPDRLDASVRFWEGSFTISSLLDEALDNCEVVFHLASTTLPKISNDDPRFDVSTNLLGTVQLLDASVRKKIRRMIFISSGGTVYGIPESVPVTENHPNNPICSYGIVKLAIEKYLRLYHRLYGVETLSLRLSNPYGEYQRVDKSQGAVTVFCHQAVTDETIEIWGDGTVVRDFIYVKDAVSAMMKSMDAPCSGLELNIGSGMGVSINDLIGMIESVMDREVSKRYVEARTCDVPEIYLDISRAKELLDWEPQVSLPEGVRNLLKSMQASARGGMSPGARR